MIPHERPRYYVLDARGEPVPCEDVITWGDWFQTAERHVAQDMDEGAGGAEIRISTVFLALDHSWWDGPPILWETLVFGGPLDGEMDRYTSRRGGAPRPSANVPAGTRGDEMSAGDPTKPGTFYERDPTSGRLHERGPRLGPGERADVWICRRVSDYPFMRPPSAAAIDRCTRCGVLLAYNPARACAAPRVCMQCAGIEPLPFGD